MFMSLISAFGFETARVIAVTGGGGKTGVLFALARLWAKAGERVLITTSTKMSAGEAEGWTVVIAATAAEVLAAAPEASPLFVHAGPSSNERKLLGLAAVEIDALAASGRFDRILIEADGSARKPLKAPAEHEPVIPAATDGVLMVAGASGIGQPLDERHVFRPEIFARLAGLPAGATVTSQAVARVAAHPHGLAKGAPTRATRVLFVNQADTPDRLALARGVAAAPDAARLRVVIGCLRPQPTVMEVRAAKS